MFVAAIAAAVLVERATAWLLYTLVGSALLAAGPEALVAAVLGLACLFLRLILLAALPLLVVQLAWGACVRALEWGGLLRVQGRPRVERP